MNPVPLADSIARLVSNFWTIAVGCAAFGDSGKGMAVDLFAPSADIVVRCTGSGNAGHTIIVDGRKIVLHLVPCGINEDRHGKLNVIGSGVAINPATLCAELDMLEREGVTYDHLQISRLAKVVCPQHLLLDRLAEALNGGVGSTGQGVGPVFTDHPARIGIIAQDLLNPDVLWEKLERNMRDKLKLLRLADPAVIQEILQNPDLQNGAFWNPTTILDLHAIMETYLKMAERFKTMIRDTDSFLREKVGKKRILLEGAQGLMLGVNHGPHPFVTSSDPSPAGMAQGAGLWESCIDLSLLTVKGPMMSKVGKGPFPTEMGGRRSEEWCEEPGITASIEAERYPTASVNDADEFVQGIAFRQRYKEFGATTGRRRRVGWLDLPMLRYAFASTRTRNIIFTKVDALDECRTVKLCTEYVYTGEPYNIGHYVLRRGMRLTETIPDAYVMAHCEPHYEKFPGWMEPTSGIREYEDMPHNFRVMMEFIRKTTGARDRIISVGPGREQTIVVG